MRYHWGLGVGHFHAHEPTEVMSVATSAEINEPEDDAEGLDEQQAPAFTVYSNADAEIPGDDSDPELGLEDHQLEGWDDVESAEEEAQFEDYDEEDEEEEFTGM